MKKSISVVIPNYNGRELLEMNLPRVYSALETSEIEDYEVIVADDVSKDESIAFLKEEYPAILCIEGKENKGFAGNVNRGIFQATKDLVLVLNSDVQLEDGYFEQLLPYFEQEDCFGVMGKIVDVEGVQVQDTAKYADYGFMKIGSTKNYEVQGRKSLYSFFLSGANALICREKLIEIGGYNELFNPYYYEDVDLGLNAWRRGYKLYYDERALCRHPNSVTINKEKKSKVRTVAMGNKIALHYLHLPTFAWICFIVFFILKSLLYLLLWKPIYYKALQRFSSKLKELKEYKDQQKAFMRYDLKAISSLINKDVKGEKLRIF